MMTPDELRKYASETTFRVLGRAILNLFAERDELREKCVRLLAGEALALKFKEDAEIQQAHLAAYERENGRLRGLLDAKTKAPWE